MKAKFSWLTDDEQRGMLDEPLPQRKHQPRRRLAWVILALLLIASLSVSYGMLERRQAAVQEQMSTDVLAAFELWQQALARGDSELLRLTVAADDAQWQRQHLRLLRRSAGGGAVDLPLEASGERERKVTFSPDLNRATVAFRGHLSAGRGERIAVERTAHFERQGQRWLQVAPDESYWGPERSHELPLLRITFPERDASIARQIGTKVNSELEAFCMATAGSRVGSPGLCGGDDKIRLELSTTLPAWRVLTGSEPLHVNGAYVLPAPALTGYPLQESDLPAYLATYTSGLLARLEATLLVPIPLPEQDLWALCYHYPALGLKLFRLDATTESWTIEDADRRFAFMSARPDGEGIVVQEARPVRAPDRLRLYDRRNGRTRLLLDEAAGETGWRAIGFTGPENTARLLLQRTDASGLLNEYSYVDLQACAAGACRREALPGYTIWSEDGAWMLYAAGSDLFFATGEGEAARMLGAGFNPLWLNAGTFAAVRFVEVEGRQVTELAAGTPQSGRLSPLLDGRDLARAAGLDDEELLYIRHVAVTGAGQPALLILATGVGDHAGSYFLFSHERGENAVPGSGRDTLLLLQREGSPGRAPGLLAPTGLPPFLVSPDGSRVVISELTGPLQERWRFLIYDVPRQTTTMLPAEIPAFPGRYPSYDWTADSRWLAFADSGSFRLFAPEAGYERLVFHGFDACIHTAWSN